MGLGSLLLALWGFGYKTPHWIRLVYQVSVRARPSAPPSSQLPRWARVSRAVPDQSTVIRYREAKGKAWRCSSVWGGLSGVSWTKPALARWQAKVLAAANDRMPPRRSFHARLRVKP